MDGVFSAAVEESLEREGDGKGQKYYYIYILYIYIIYIHIIYITLYIFILCN